MNTKIKIAATRNARSSRLTAQPPLIKVPTPAPLRDADEPAVTPGSGNVYADLGFPDAEERFAKATIAIHIKRAIKAWGLTQKEAGELMGLDQPKVSAIVRGRLDGYSSDRLLRFLNDLGCDVAISVSEPNPEGRGRLICG